MLYNFVRFDSEYGKIMSAIEKEMHSNNKHPIFVSGLCVGASDALLCAFSDEIYKSTHSPQLILCGNEKECARVSTLLSQQGMYFPYYRARDFVFNNISSSHTDECERLKILYSLLQGNCNGVVTTPHAFLQYTVPADVLSDNILLLELGAEYDQKHIVEKLIYMGYARTEIVDSQGQFSTRGDIIDIFVPFVEDGAARAIRIEFFGDSVDRIGFFDINTQRVCENAQRVSIFPVREVLYGEEQRQQIKKSIVSLQKKEKDEQRLRSLASELSAAELSDIPFADKYISLIYKKPGTLADYLSDDTVAFIAGSASVRSQLEASCKLNYDNIENMLEQRCVSRQYARYMSDVSDFEAYFTKHASVHLDSFLSGASYSKTSVIFGMRTRQSAGGSNITLLCEDIENYIRGSYRIVIGAASSAETQNLAALLREKGMNVSECYQQLPQMDELEAKLVYITKATLKEGYELSGARFAYICFSEKANANKSRLISAKRKKYSSGKKITSYADLSEGDYVVHEAYGIGMYKGLTKITSSEGITKEYITIQYAGTDKLFIPAERLEQISKYIGAHSDDGLLKLSKMGGAEWHKQTSRAKASVKKMAKELIDLYARRMRRSGFAYPPDDAMQEEFDSSFPYEETLSQLEAIDAIKHDMMRAVPMDRLLCGDVGYGKTEVALRAAFKAVEAGKQVALLCPTTILAYQHYQTALSRFGGFPVRIDMISRFRSAKEQKEILRRVKRGDVDIIVGTHKLVYGDVEFKDLGLLIIDEEQRFGVAQKEKLKQFATDIDVLSLSATPIPRTLNMAMGGIRDMSVLDEVPGERVPVQTYVLEYDAQTIYEAIRRELARGGQVFYLYNKVEDINNVATRIADSIDGINVAVAHGQMDKSEIESIWQQLVDGTIDVLVCTSIIETGVDVPNANTLIVENADRLGLSQLHQLRGRVGRSSRRAYAYFTYRQGKVLSEIAEKRLMAIREYAQFGAGFKVALRDLEIRGAGNMLGAEQHGHLDAVGYDMYIKLLNEAVLEEKGEKKPEKCECKLDIKVNAYIPESYIRSASMRMEQYKRIALILSEQDADDICDELIDRFGEYPVEVENLLKIAQIKALCENSGIERVIQNEGNVSIYPQKMRIEVWSMLDFSDNEYKLKINLTSSPHLTFKIPKNTSATDACINVIGSYFEKCSQTDNPQNT